MLGQHRVPAAERLLLCRSLFRRIFLGRKMPMFRARPWLPIVLGLIVGTLLQVERRGPFLFLDLVGRSLALHWLGRLIVPHLRLGRLGLCPFLLGALKRLLDCLATAFGPMLAALVIRPDRLIWRLRTNRGRDIYRVLIDRHLGCAGPGPVQRLRLT